jgi:hypothetical protein
MFSRTNFTNPYQSFQSFGFGAPQFGLGAGFNGINPLIPNLMNPYVNNPLLAFNGAGVGVNPWGAPVPYGINPLLTQGLAQGPAQGLGLQFLPGINPFGGSPNWTPHAYSPYAQQTPGYGAYGYPGIQQGFVGQNFGGNQPTPFGNSFTGPFAGMDPFTAATISQQIPPTAFGQLPIRPLINPQQSLQLDPHQAAALGQATAAGNPYWASHPYAGIQGGYPVCP